MRKLASLCVSSTAYIGEPQNWILEENVFTKQIVGAIKRDKDFKSGWTRQNVDKLHENLENAHSEDKDVTNLQKVTFKTFFGC
jgi:hypothetical protein